MILKCAISNISSYFVDQCIAYPFLLKMYNLDSISCHYFSFPVAMITVAGAWGLDSLEDLLIYAIK